jgi:RimJ/RimL family protein N-acetyltransferase
MAAVMIPGPDIVPASLQHATGLQAAIASVARERRYLVSLEGFTAAETQAFIQSILNGWGVQRLALHDGDVVGWCDIRRSPCVGFEHIGVLGMGVVAGWRGQGLGLRLLQATVAASADLFLSRIELEVFASNTTALRLYERFGFVREGLKRRGRILDGVADDIVCMAWLRDD